ncbi:amidase [Salipiger abyssi]|uniref:amidase n=1 Tax=Salipiger abyssi TaxID=1250539 RepID=UPI001A8D8255|nr:amidase [Salipiger abyssi]MBN9888432.1 amidase [Salipiger abyssi]
MHRQTVHTIQQTLLKRERSAAEIVADALARAEEVQKHCNAFTRIFAEEALQSARRADEALAGGKPMRALEGVPVCIKDMTPIAGHPPTYGTWARARNGAPGEAVIVSRLKRAGAIVLARTTTAELAFSSFTATERYGVTRNPWDGRRTSGGSSGGSAVAVAAGVVPLAEGSDMGGSVRIPAAACGVVGFKPSLGRIPMDILPTPCDTISHFGPLAGSVQDAVTFLSVTAGHSPADLLSQKRPFRATEAAPGSVPGLRIAASVDLGYCGVSPEVAETFHTVLDRLRAHGADIREVRLPWTRAVFDLWATHWNALLCAMAEEFEDTSRMGVPLRRCLAQGQAVRARDLMQADRLRKAMAADMAGIFEHCDAFLCPTLARLAPAVDKTDADFEDDLPDGRFHAFDMTHPFNMLSAYPAISMPVSLSGDLPVGIQIVGPAYEDERTLAVAGAFEKLFPPLPLPKF